MNTSRPIVCSLVLAILVAGCAPTPTPAPTSYAKWAPNEAYFHLQYPEGWKAEGGGKQGIQWAEFSQGSCKITASTDVASSLIGDIVGSASGFGGGIGAVDPETAEKLAPVARVHEMKLRELPAEYKSYKEQEDDSLADIRNTRRPTPGVPSD